MRHFQGTWRQADLNVSVSRQDQDPSCAVQNPATVLQRLLRGVRASWNHCHGLLVLRIGGNRLVRHPSVLTVLVAVADSLDSQRRLQSILGGLWPASMARLASGRASLSPMRLVQAPGSMIVESLSSVG